LQIKHLMQQMTEQTDNPIDGLEEITRKLQQQLEVDLVR
jgi:hypothetical protein